MLPFASLVRLSIAIVLGVVSGARVHTSASMCAVDFPWPANIQLNWLTRRVVLRGGDATRPPLSLHLLCYVSMLYFVSPPRPTLPPALFARALLRALGRVVLPLLRADSRMG